MQDSYDKFDWGQLKSRIGTIMRPASEQLSAQQIDDILRERALRFQKEETSLSEDSEEMIMFRQGDTHYAIALCALAEIRPIAKITVLPKVSHNILGVINVRGRIVAVYNLSMNKIPMSRLTQGSALIGHDLAASLAIFADDVVGIASIRPSDIKSAPISVGDKDYITGVGKDGLVILDLAKLVNNQQYFCA